MDFSLNDQQKLIRDTVRQFVETEVRPTVKERDRVERFPADEIRKIAALGCCGMLLPEEWGGPGLDHISYVLMLEEVARVDTAMSTSLGVTNSAVQSSAPSASPSHKPAPMPQASKPAPRATATCTNFTAPKPGLPMAV